MHQAIKLYARVQVPPAENEDLSGIGVKYFHQIYGCRNLAQAIVKIISRSVTIIICGGITQMAAAVTGKYVYLIPGGNRIFTSDRCADGRKARSYASVKGWNSPFP
jgi:hypothetical protein